MRKLSLTKKLEVLYFALPYYTFHFFLVSMIDGFWEKLILWMLPVGVTGFCILSLFIEDEPNGNKNRKPVST